MRGADLGGRAVGRAAILGSSVSSQPEDVPTLVESGTLTGPDAASASGPRGASASSSRVRSFGAEGSVVSPADALRRDERVRYRLLGYSGALLALLAALMGPLLPGEPRSFAILYASLGSVLLANIALLYQVSSPERFQRVPVALSWSAATLGVLGVSTYFGLFSPAPMALLIGFYVVGRSTMPGVPQAVYLTGAVGHAVLVVCLAQGLVPDGLVSSPRLSLPGLLAVEALVQALLIATWIAAREAQSELERSLDELDGAVRAVAGRQAVLDEVRADFEQAAHLGVPGRLTDTPLGPYRLGEVIGRGAMGEIYSARAADGSEAAVKVLFPHLLSDPSMRARFVRESEAIAALDSPHVVRVHAIGGSQQGLSYLAMERLHGADLAEILRSQRRLRPSECVELAEHVLDGLAAADRAGLVHRDIKPQNLFRAVDGETTRWKILDFGVSRLVGAGATMTGGQVVGTPRYMAPEQAKADTIDGRADLYGLGAVLYRCLTGRPPFTGDDVHRVLHLVTHEMPAQPSKVAELPVDLDAFFAVLLAKEPDARLEAELVVPALRDALASRLHPAIRSRASELTARWPWSTRV